MRKGKRMNRIAFLIAVTSAVVFSPFAVCSAQEAIEPKKRTVLFDGKRFDGWFRYLRNNRGDVDETWKVKSGGILTCAGEPRGYIRTTTAYKNYKLHV